MKHLRCAKKSCCERCVLQHIMFTLVIDFEGMEQELGVVQPSQTWECSVCSNENRLLPYLGGAIYLAPQWHA